MGIPMSKSEYILKALKLLNSIEEDIRRELPKECFAKAKEVLDELRRELVMSE